MNILDILVIGLLTVYITTASIYILKLIKFRRKNNLNSNKKNSETLQEEQTNNNEIQHTYLTEKQIEKLSNSDKKIKKNRNLQNTSNSKINSNNLEK